MKTTKPKDLNDFISSGKADQQANTTTNRNTGMPASQRVKPKMVTYYINKPELIKKLKQVGLDSVSSSFSKS